MTMDSERLRALFEELKRGSLSVEDALERIGQLPFEDLSFARVDHHRTIRCGFPEVIFCEGKEVEEIASIAGAILKKSNRMLATRASSSAFEVIRRVNPAAKFHERARCVTVETEERPPGKGRVVIISAGTADAAGTNAQLTGRTGPVAAAAVTRIARRVDAGAGCAAGVAAVCAVAGRPGSWVRRAAGD